VAHAPALIDFSGASPESRLGLIDIGSNSVRFVVFDRLSLSPVSLFNEKALCGLARALPITGKLDREGRELAERTITRFVALARGMALGRLDVIATAAVREAEDGPAFVADLEKRLRIKIRVLSGEEEARLVGLAITATVPGADGVVGDLGGGSLELVDISEGRIGTHATLPLGALRLQQTINNSKDEKIGLAKLIETSLSEIPWLGNMRGRTFYAVGGVWRALARMDIERRDYPLHVVDRYSLPRREAETLVSLVARMGPASLKKVRGVNTRRLETLPTGAMIMNRLLEGARPSRVVFSAVGLREGHVINLLEADARQSDPLIAGCEAAAARVGRFGAIGQELFDFTSPLFSAETPAFRRRRLAASLLADIAWREHPDYRPLAALHHALQLSLAGLDQQDRATLALALYYRYGGRAGDELPRTIRTVLDEDEAEGARRLGLAMRLGMTLSAGNPGILPHARLQFDEDRLVLHLDVSAANLAGESIEKRMRVLSQKFGPGIRPEIRTA